MSKLLLNISSKTLLTLLQIQMILYDVEALMVLCDAAQSVQT